MFDEVDPNSDLGKKASRLADAAVKSAQARQRVGGDQKQIKLDAKLHQGRFRRFAAVSALAAALTGGWVLSQEDEGLEVAAFGLATLATGATATRHKVLLRPYESAIATRSKTRRRAQDLVTDSHVSQETGTLEEKSTNLVTLTMKFASEKTPQVQQEIRTVIKSAEPFFYR